MQVGTFPGVAVTQRGSRLVGIGAVVVAALVLIAIYVAPSRGNRDAIGVTLTTEQIGEGVGTGTEVRLDGVRVGEIMSIEPEGIGRQRIGLELEPTQLFGLTDALHVNYAPSNLFGISELELEPGTGGVELRDGSAVDLTGRDANRVYDATISTLLGSLGTFTGEVLTPEFTRVFSQIAHDTRAFTPIFQAMISLARSVADTQQYPTPFLLREFGNTLDGAAPLIDGALRMLYLPYQNEHLQTEENLIKTQASIDTLSNHLLPDAGKLVETAQRYFDGYTDDMLSPVLNMLAATVSAPERSTRELSVLLDRLSNSFHDGPNGPVLNVNLVLAGVPALSVPLLGGQPMPAGVR